MDCPRLPHFGLTMTNGELKFGDVLRTLVKFNFQQQMFDELPPESAAAQEAINAAGEDGASKGSAGQSMLWADGMTAEKKEVAQRFALELLRLSNGTREPACCDATKGGASRRSQRSS